ncbi:MAG: HIT domain-containing protein, partial [Pseudomonadota bacterium]|nr:HIT domain-containing protein [Pseudomonadota bacterium]
SEAEIVAYVRALAKVARAGNVTETGYRVISNTGADGHQEVPHLHFHIIGGAPAGPMARRMDVDADG